MHIKKLKAGDCVGIVAPAKRIDFNEIAFAIEVFENWGLEVKLGKTIGEGEFLFSGTDDERAKDFQEMIDDDTVSAIFSARGGYGCARIIDQLNFGGLAKNPKWLIGFSDFTVIHNHLYNKINLPTLHASMPVFFKENTEAALKSIYQVLFHQEINYQVNSAFLELCKNGETVAEIVGGNLSVIYSLLGSSSGLKRGKYILFLEDLAEYFYHVDRMMQNLKRNHIFSELAGVIIGNFTDMKDGALPFGKNPYEIIFDYFKDLNIPVFTGFPAGHSADNRALIFGKEIMLKVEDGKCFLKTI